MKIKILLIAILCVASHSFSQYKLDYDKDSKWFWDFNYGATWHTSDLKTKLDNGIGFTVGKSFNFNYGKKLSFDLRARFLAGDWRGQSKNFRVLDSTYSGVYSDTYTDYKTLNGGVVENFETSVRRLSVELVIHLNALRESTGWDPYIFGGIGYTWSRTRGDLLDSLGNMYPYAEDQKYSMFRLNQMMDNVYETPLENGFKTDTPKLMPSIGFGLGYQVAKRVSLGIEHKTTFTQTDIFDGIIKESKYLQDLYHYTSAYIRFQIKSKKYQEYEEPAAPVKEVVKAEEIFTQPPVVTLTQPQSTRTIVQNQTSVINATILYVRGKENVIFKHNSNDVSTFSYNNNSKQFSRSVVLQKGENQFVIKGENEYGLDSVVFIIIYEEPQGVPPIVNIINPSVDFSTVNNANYFFKAKIENVSAKNQISLNVNGNSLSNFTFNVSTKEVGANLNLAVGNNLITISATNEFGSDSKTTAINYTVPSTPRTPVTPSTPSTPNPRTPTPSSPSPRKPIPTNKVTTDNSGGTKTESGEGTTKEPLKESDTEVQQAKKVENEVEPTINKTVEEVIETQEAVPGSTSTPIRKTRP